MGVAWCPGAGEEPLPPWHAACIHRISATVASPPCAALVQPLRQWFRVSQWRTTQGPMRSRRLERLLRPTPPWKGWRLLVEQWRAQWGFLDDTDFAHAFASYDSAIAHGGHHVVDAWLQGRSRNMEDELIPRAAAVAESSGSTDRPPRWAEALPICRGVRIYGRALFRMGHAKLYVPRSPSPSPTGHREHWLDLDHREHWLDLDPRALAICLGIRPVDTAKQPESAFGHVWRMCYSKPAGHVYVGMGNHAHRLPTTKWKSPWQIGVNCTRHSHTTSSTCGRRYGMSWRSWRAWSWCVIAPCPKHVRLTYWRGLSLTDRA